MSEYKRKISIRGIEFDVSFDFTPEEKAVMYYPDGSGYPGCASKIHYWSIEHNGEEFTDFFDKEQELIEDLIWQTFEE